MADPLTFAAEIENWAGDECRQAVTALVRQSAQDLIAACNTPQPSVEKTGGSFEIGKVPVRDGYLRNSLVVEVNGAVVATGGEAAVGAGQAEVGDFIEASWSATYAPYIEYGTGRIAPRYFVSANVELWPSIVETNAAAILRGGA